MISKLVRNLKGAALVALASVNGCCGFPEGKPPWPQGKAGAR